VTVGSVEREEYGHLEDSHKRIRFFPLFFFVRISYISFFLCLNKKRGDILSSGYAFRETSDPEVVRGTYVIQVDPKVNIDEFIFVLKL